MSLAQDLSRAHMQRRNKFFPQIAPTVWAPPAAVPVDPIEPPPYNAKAAIEALQRDFEQLRATLVQSLIIDSDPRAAAPEEPISTIRPSVALIQRVVCEYYGTALEDILSSRRTAAIVRPRQIAVYLAKTMTLRSLPDIGSRFGGRDHTTIIFSIRKIERLIAVDPSMLDEINELKRRIAERFKPTKA